MPSLSAPSSRLALAFVSLGVGLLIAVGAFVHSALSRLAEQRELRHRMVAERVFDEVEREIGLVLQYEARRPSSAYDATDTDPAHWFPFVVGYYHRDAAVKLVVPSKLNPERRTLLHRAVASVREVLDQALVAPPAQPPDLDRDADRDDLGKPSSPDVLRQLNRGVKVRERRKRVLGETFVVFAADSERLVVERKSPDFERREGFVLDVPVLVETIQREVLGAQGLDAVAALSATPTIGSRSPNGYEFIHRMAPPLETQSVYLHLSQLDDEDATSTLYGLATLLSLAAIAGLLALYRTVAVTVRFAERRNNFVSAVTHELKTPLTAIRMYGEMLRDGMAEDEAIRQEYYATITAESERLTRLINNVMEHGRLRRGQRPAHLQSVEVGSVVREVAELMAPHIEEEGFDLDLAIEPGLPPAKLDVDAFKQVLFNLLDNALKYGKGASAKRLSIRCEAHTDGGVRVTIRDYGPGIEQAHERLIFEPFFRGGDELTRRQKGTGIGLSLVRDLVALMGGTVRGVNRDPGFEVQIAVGSTR